MKKQLMLTFFCWYTDFKRSAVYVYIIQKLSGWLYKCVLYSGSK
jgi:hypothetical protein